MHIMNMYNIEWRDLEQDWRTILKHLSTSTSMIFTSPAQSLRQRNQNDHIMRKWNTMWSTSSGWTDWSTEVWHTSPSKLDSTTTHNWIQVAAKLLGSSLRLQAPGAEAGSGVESREGSNNESMRFSALDRASMAAFSFFLKMPSTPSRVTFKLQSVQNCENQLF